MFRDTLILLILKEFLNDINICLYIKGEIDRSEVNDSHIIYNMRSKYYLQDIKLLYPGLFKTALFTNIKFDSQDDLEPGYSYYTIKPLTHCGDLSVPYKRDGVFLINSLRKKYTDLFISRVIKKRNRYSHYDLLYSRQPDRCVISLWFDFEMNEIISFSCC